MSPPAMRGDSTAWRFPSPNPIFLTYAGSRSVKVLPPPARLA